MSTPRAGEHPSTCFSGLLSLGSDGWTWQDGVPEPRMAHGPSCAANLRARDEDARRLVEVPMVLCDLYDPLRWVLDGATDGTLDLDVSSGCFPALGRRVGSSAQVAERDRGPVLQTTGIMVVLVPHATWAAWCRTCSVIPTWRIEDEAALQQRALGLGWKDATRLGVGGPQTQRAGGSSR